jgi:hypothetical protein
MGEFGKWLLHEDRKELFEVLFACFLNVFFVVLLALLLWPFGKVWMAYSLAQGFGILWTVIYAAALLVGRVQGFFKVNLYDHPDAYVNSNLAVSCFVQAGWSAFAVLTVQRYAAGAPLWMIVSLYVVGLLSCLVAFFIVSSCYQGHIYRLISLPLALACFIVFSVWPASGRFIYGWFFNLLGAQTA